jgi:nicotinamide-nucleotide adenylyltransferase
MRTKDEKLGMNRLRGIISGAPLEGPAMLQWVRRAPRGIRGPGKSLGVLPSSFNPPTEAHRLLVEKARTVDLIDEILLILDRKSVDKGIFGASLEERLWMILLCFESDPTVSVAFTNRGLFSEKLTLVMKAYPDNTMIRFIVGYDTLIRVLDAKYYKNRDDSLSGLFADSHFLVAPRGRVGINGIKRLLNRRENRPFAKRITLFEIPSSVRQLSSSRIRNDIHEERNIDDRVPPEILSYLRTKGLYRNPERSI